jgi:hypothetical protein
MLTVVCTYFSMPRLGKKLRGGRFVLIYVEIVGNSALVAFAFWHYGLPGGLAYLVAWLAFMIWIERYCLKVLEREIDAAKRAWHDAAKKAGHGVP